VVVVLAGALVEAVVVGELALASAKAVASDNPPFLPPKTDYLTTHWSNCLYVV